MKHRDKAGGEGPPRGKGPSGGRLRAGPVGILVAALLFAGLVGLMIYLNVTTPEGVLSSAQKQLYLPARVVRVISDDAEPDDIRSEGRRLGTQEIEIEITGGLHKGDRHEMTNYLSALANVDVREGTRVIVRIVDTDDGGYYPLIHNYDRGLVIGVFVLCFAALLVAIGGRKGLKALLGLLFTVVCLWFLMIPLMMRGCNTILTAVFLVAVTTAASLLLLDGFTKKALSAVLGCVGGVTVAGLIALLVGAITPLNGFNMSEAENLIFHATDGGMKISGLLVCGVLISALGAIMDVAMSISSAVHELHELNPELSAGRLFRSGMNIGRDAMGTMANTLILAFAGSSLNMFILVNAYDIPFIQLINTDFIVIEILQSVSGSVGIVLTVPFVALIASRIMSGGRISGGEKPRKQ